MGANQNNPPDKTKGKKSRGSVRNTARLEAFGNGRSKGSADWATCDGKWVQAVVESITGLGGAVTFGLSRDEGAYSVTLLLDGERETLWYNGDSDMDEKLEEVCRTLGQMT